MLGGSGTTIPKISAILVLACAVIGVVLAVITGLSWVQALCISVAVFALSTVVTIHQNHIVHRLGAVDFWIGRHALVITIVSLVVAAGGITGSILLGPDEDATGQVGDEPRQEQVKTAPSVGGWGPARQTFTKKSAAPYPLLNSIVDADGHGDERNFVQVRQRHEENSKYVDLLSVRPGDELVVYAWVGNDAADRLQGPLATIYGLRARCSFLALNDPDALTISVKLSGLNVRDVWDSADLQSNEQIKLSVVSGSAVMHTNEGEFTIDDAALRSSDGALLGSSKPDGELPVGSTPEGKYVGAGYLLFHVKVDAKEV